MPKTLIHLRRHSSYKGSRHGDSTVLFENQNNWLILLLKPTLGGFTGLMKQSKARPILKYLEVLHLNEAKFERYSIKIILVALDGQHKMLEYRGNSKFLNKIEFLDAKPC